MELRSGKISSPGSKSPHTATDAKHKKREEKKKNEKAINSLEIESESKDNPDGNGDGVDFATSNVTPEACKLENPERPETEEKKAARITEHKDERVEKGQEQQELQLRPKLTAVEQKTPLTTKNTAVAATTTTAIQDATPTTTPSPPPPPSPPTTMKETTPTVPKGKITPATTIDKTATTTINFGTTTTPKSTEEAKSTEARRRVITNATSETVKQTAATEGMKAKGEPGTEPKQRSRRLGLRSIFLKCIVVCCTITLMIYYIVGYCRPDEIDATPPILNDANDTDYYVKVFNKSITDMKSSFPKQTSRFWQILNNRGLAHLKNDNPKQPLVIMLVAPPTAHSVVDCLALTLARSLDPERNANVINGSDYSEGDGHVIKKILEKKLEKLFQNGVRAVLVLHLDRFPQPSPLLFYRYCDSETAPYKRPAIIFTVKIPDEPSPSLGPVQAEGLVEKYLKEVVWFNEERDATQALLTRVTDTVALVSGESSDVLHSQCKIK